MDNVPARRPESDGSLRPLPLPRVGPMDLYAALLTDARCANTREARDYDARMFARFLGRAVAEACATLIAGGRGNANALALAFRDYEQRRGTAATSINRRMTTLRRVVFLARRFDLVEWTLDVDDFKVVSHRDTRGPGLEGWRALWQAAVDLGDTSQARRNRALLRLIHDNGMRRCEAIGIDYPEDVDLAGGRISIKGKGQSSKVWVTTSERCVGLVREWLDARGKRPGPLFCSHARVNDAERGELADRVAGLQAEGLTLAAVAELLNREGMRTPSGLPWNTARLRDRLGNDLAPLRRMDDRTINQVFRYLTDLAGLERPVRPHGIRHQAITRVLDITNGNVRAAQKFARHARVSSTMIYDDNRLDLAGDMARLLGADE